MSANINDRNRQNAQHSTGPRTEEGKAKSSQNARTHGLSSAKLFLPADRLEEFHSLYTALYEEIRPVGELQMQFFEQLVHASWNTNLARTLLAHAWEKLDEKAIANANRYVNQYERSFAKALKEIKTLQTDLALRAIRENEPIADLPFTCEIKVIANEATKLARQTAPPPERPTRRTAILTQIGAAFDPLALETRPNEEIPLAA